MSDDWRIVFSGYDPERQGLREALHALGNGYLGSRAAAPDARADGTHYPGTYLAGCYNRLTTEIAGREVAIEDVVNLPNWLPLAIRIDGDDWLHPDQGELADYQQVLDLRHGILERRYRIRDGRGRETRIDERRLVHLRQRHLMALEVAASPLNWSGHVEVRSALDGWVENAGVARYQAFNKQHLRVLAAESDDEVLFLKAETVQSEVRIALAARSRLYLDGRPLARSPDVVLDEDCCAHVFAPTLPPEATLRVCKTAAVYSSRDAAVAEPGEAARWAVAHAPETDALFASQAAAWSHLWQRFDLRLTAEGQPAGNGTASVLRLHLFHVLQTVSAEGHAPDAGVPARGWQGEAYHGHIFWDELFVFPVINLRAPQHSYGLLAYRHRRLDAARAHAAAHGYRGAMYPWQSGSDGREETQALHLNPRSRRWLPDNSMLQRHVSAAVAFNMWEFYQATGDIDFLNLHAAEVILEVARFWASAATYNASRERYDIAGVMGPDEYHDAYPGADRPGLRNNAYTNVMAAWVLARGLEIMETLPPEATARLRDLLDIDDAELAHWDEVSRKLTVVFQDDGIISQFEGYAELAEFDWEGYKAKYGDIQRLDRILEAEGDTPNRYKVSKQADVLMLFYLFSAEELDEIFTRLGYAFDPECIPRNIDYYLARTSHGSTLSRVVHAWVLARQDRAASWQMFQEALSSDICDIQGGTTAEGVHLGAMAGTVDLIQRCYTGVELRRDALHFNPTLPTELHQLAFPLRYRRQSLEVEVNHETLTLTAGRRVTHPVSVVVRGRATELHPGDTRVFAL